MMDWLYRYKMKMNLVCHHLVYRFGTFWYINSFVLKLVNMQKALDILATLGYSNHFSVLF